MDKEENKELADWSFDKLVDFSAWKAVEQLLAGMPLRSVIYGACQLTAMWRTDKTREERKKAGEQQ